MDWVSDPPEFVFAIVMGTLALLILPFILVLLPIVCLTYIMRNWNEYGD